MTENPTPAEAASPRPTSPRPGPRDGRAGLPAPGSTTAPSPGPELSRRRLLLGTAALGALAVGSAAVAPEAAHAHAVGRPAIITTAAWGARPPRRHLHTIARRPGYLVIHHTAHENGAGTSAGAAHALGRLLQRNHLRRGWADTGQHFTIARGGQVLEGRHGSAAALDAGTRFVEGAHAYGFNDESIGIEVDGMYVSALPTAAQWNALVRLCAYACRRYGIRVQDIIAHRDVPGARTECCGDALYARLPALRRAVAAALGGSTLGFAGAAGGGSAGSAGAGGSYPSLRRGARGAAVRRLQSALRDAGHSPGAVDGVFGARTERAVRSYQRALGMSVEGVAGPRTWGSIVTRPARGTSLSRGDSGTQVRHLQRGLSATLRRSVVVDGRFGPATQVAVRSYQSSRGLPPVGVAGPQTWFSLKRGR
ncbi:N-acetylmuramoyl-L-alanine amidase [Citricoccus sp. SGAir0253]|uniref:peptidoglycan recognition protein family protein n=1 Tax=Citricoccus sp. SGAir0253 TaxID=2567881 RepID=UPI0010CCFDFB|nr:N-acetylmuramoyl-L-alanine amidase [Citricoccus sp. SGAir0253]QCU77515.1 N-acetylmuramoyl-L-alanine amidase [Citricoccus sp. SGAir0253]